MLGTGATYKEGDELRHMQLRDFDGYGGEDTETLSEYSFYRYRIAQFLDDLDLENINVEEENERLAMLNKAITRFISAYEAALEAREPGEKPVRIRSFEFRDYTKANRPERRNDTRSGNGSDNTDNQ